MLTLRWRAPARAVHLAGYALHRERPADTESLTANDTHAADQAAEGRDTPALRRRRPRRGRERQPADEARSDLTSVSALALTQATRHQRRETCALPGAPTLTSMFSFGKPATMVTAEALPGRAEAMPVPERHEVLGTPLAPPFPDGFEQAIFGMGCFWGAEREFWQAPGVYTTAVGYAGGFTPNPTYEEVCSGRTGHTEVVLVVFDPAQTSYEELLRVFWENHDPTQGMRQGNDVGTQYRSAIYWTSEAQREAAEASRAMFQRELARAGYGAITTEIADGRPVLLRRGLPPAVPGEEPGRLLRPRRHRRLVPGWSAAHSNRVLGSASRSGRCRRAVI